MRIVQNSTLEIYLLTDNHSYNEAVGTIKQINPDEVQTNHTFQFATC